MLSAIESSNEILPGYVLVDRLGSGGYAEVWRASAPGGLFKAIKIVHGFYDEELAAQEMKAMERIKDVRHPFLLSLERFDVIEGRLVILTEMADKSLEQRACECRAEGLAGIPREELFGYLEDAAEALDYLVEKKNLLHLDVKPENLLLLGEHLKVADFGLVKEFATRSQKSMIAGMTPTFAAPEMFDDHPSKRSDQYSLAIVYQLMLTGTLPFPGRTAAQLAKQHTLSPPQLTSLPPGDRDILARALAKDPNHRFPGCRAMISALREVENKRSRPEPVAAPSPVGATLPKRNPPSDPQRETDSSSSEVTLPRKAPVQAIATQHLGKGGVAAIAEALPTPSAPLREERIVDIASPAASGVAGPLPTLTVAIGGVATRLLARVLEVEGQIGESAESPASYLAIDTDRADLKKCCTSGSGPALSSDDILHLPLRLPKDYDSLRKQLEWLSRRWLYNIPRSLETRGYRPLGRLALVDHLDKVLRVLESRMKGMLGGTAASDGEQSPPRELRVVLLAGMGGGTGGGMAIDVAYAIRHVAARLGAQVTIEGFFLGCPLATASASGLATANMFALLGELRQVAASGNRGALHALSGEHPLEGGGPPFEATYLIAHPNSADATQGFGLIDNTASYLAWARRHPLFDWRVACRGEKTPQENQSGEPLLLRSLGFASLSQAIDARRQIEAEKLRQSVWRFWLSQGISSVKRPTTIYGKELDGCDDESPEELLVSRDERLRARFQQAATTRFAEDVAEVLISMWPTDEGATEMEDPRVVAGIKRLAGALEIQTERMSAESAEGVSIEIPPHAIGRRVLQQLMAMPQWSTFDAAHCLRAIDERLFAECRTLLESQVERQETGHLASEALDQATGAVLTCGFDRRSLAFLPKTPQFEGVASSLATARPEAHILRGDGPVGWIAVEGSGISSQSLAVRMSHIYPDIAEAAERLHTRADIRWLDPLCES